MNRSHSKEELGIIVENHSRDISKMMDEITSLKISEQGFKSDWGHISKDIKSLTDVLQSTKDSIAKLSKHSYEIESIKSNIQDLGDIQNGMKEKLDPVFDFVKSTQKSQDKFWDRTRGYLAVTGITITIIGFISVGLSEYIIYLNGKTPPGYEVVGPGSIAPTTNS